MSGIAITGMGAVSPYGWGVSALCEGVASGVAVAGQPLERPGWPRPLMVRRVPPPKVRPTELAHARLRRAGPISQFAAIAAVEALADVRQRMERLPERVGVVFTTTAGGVHYSRRFYHEVLQEPATASPLLFPETVFNAPASHISAVLASKHVNYTLAGDAGVFLHGLALAARWLAEDRVDACVVVAAEEMDWLTADVLGRFSRSLTFAEGAAALMLERAGVNAIAPRLETITEPATFAGGLNRRAAAQRVAGQLTASTSAELLALGLAGVGRIDGAESRAWQGRAGTRLLLKPLLGEGLAAGCGWQCVAAVDALRSGRYARAVVSVPGAYREFIGASFHV